jgi:hypothetical protein
VSKPTAPCHVGRHRAAHAQNIGPSARQGPDRRYAYVRSRVGESEIGLARRAAFDQGRRSVGVSYFLGEEIAKLVGEIGTKALIGVIVLVVAGLLIKARVSRWRGVRQERLAGQDPSKVEAA